MRTTQGKIEVMKSVIEVIFTLLWLTVTAGSAEQLLNTPQVPFNPSPTFDPGATLQKRLLNSAGAYLPGLGFKYPSFNQHDILRYLVEGNSEFNLEFGIFSRFLVCADFMIHISQ